jgi:hypothetical protein
MKTIERWDRDPDLGFPPAIEINHRKYRDIDQINAFAASKLKTSISAERVARAARARRVKKERALTTTE